MKIIQSLWTKGMSDEVLQKNKTYYSLSSKFLKSAGYPVELYTDSKGAEIFDATCFYDKIHKDLDKINFFSKDLWSGAKITSLIYAKGPAVHVDGDVFFRNKSFLKSLIESDWDILVQSQELSEHYYYNYEKSIEIFTTICEFKDPWIATALRYYNYTHNCGVLGFKNFQTTQNYAKVYFDLFNILNTNQDIIEKYKSLKDYRPWVRSAKVDINCIIEQVQLTFFANFYNLRVKEAVPIYNWSDPRWQYVQNFQEAFGYEHLAGQAKFTDDEFYKKYLEELNGEREMTKKDIEMGNLSNYE
jgi:hypothetical protein